MGNRYGQAGLGHLLNELIADTDVFIDGFKSLFNKKIKKENSSAFNFLVQVIFRDYTPYEVDKRFRKRVLWVKRFICRRWRWLWQMIT